LGQTRRFGFRYGQAFRLPGRAAGAGNGRSAGVRLASFRAFCPGHPTSRGDTSVAAGSGFHRGRRGGSYGRLRLGQLGRQPVDLALLPVNVRKHDREGDQENDERGGRGVVPRPAACGAGGARRAPSCSCSFSQLRAGCQPVPGGGVSSPDTFCRIILSHSSIVLRDSVFVE
jgi:hypothetical protein